MPLNPVISLWARTALVWFMLTIAFGMYLGLTSQFQFSSPHAHMGVLRWVSSVLFALLHALARIEQTSAARAHWAMHNLGLVMMVAGLVLTIRNGESSLTILIPLGGTIVFVGLVWIATLLWPRLASR
ncbi:MAG: hypothetical protein ACT4OE_07745 [Sphingosinicella sp.]